MIPKSHLLSRAFFRIPIAIPKVTSLATAHSSTHPIRLLTQHSRPPIRIPAIRVFSFCSFALRQRQPVVVRRDVEEVILPNHRLLARAFYRIPSGTSNARNISSSSASRASSAGDHAAREADSHNVQQDASRAGKAERARGEGGSATSEKAGRKDGEDLNKKAEKDNKEAPRPVIGMNDERGSKGH